jgi:hypothetical protein
MLSRLAGSPPVRNTRRRAIQRTLEECGPAAETGMLRPSHLILSDTFIVPIRFMKFTLEKLYVTVVLVTNFYFIYVIHLQRFLAIEEEEAALEEASGVSCWRRACQSWAEEVYMCTVVLPE